MKLTLTEIKKRAWETLLHKVKVINVTETKGCLAKSEYTDDSITIWVDHLRVRCDNAVIHEILHMLLDKYFDPFTYYVYELFINTLEERFFKTMSKKELKKWQYQIKRKIVRKRDTHETK